MLPGLPNSARAPMSIAGLSSPEKQSPNHVVRTGNRVFLPLGFSRPRSMDPEGESILGADRQWVGSCIFLRLSDPIARIGREGGARDLVRSTPGAKDRPRLPAVPPQGVVQSTRLFSSAWGFGGAGLEPRARMQD